MSPEQKDFKIPEKVATMLIQGYCLVSESCSECKGLLVRSKKNELICVKCFCESANRRSNKHELSDDDEDFHGDEKNIKSESMNQLNPSKLIKLDTKEKTGQSNEKTINREQLEDFYRDFYLDLSQLKLNHNSQDIVNYFDSNKKRK